jgi:hypothetical protein
MNSLEIIALPPDHPHYAAVELASVELLGGLSAAAGGNSGRARVCARRAVGAYLRAIAPSLDGDVGSNAMAALRYVQESAGLPEEPRSAALRLTGGARSELAGGPVSSDPLADAALIINYFVRQASSSPSDH